MDNLPEDELTPSAKPVEPASESKVASLNKFEAKRRANKLRKKRAHRRTLRRSNTKG
jgi:hypothetical protein